MRVELVLSLTVSLLSSVISCYDLTLLHVNDIHVRMEEINKYSSTCKESQREAGQCYGGVARLRTAVREIKKTKQNVLWLNGGDFFQGTIWYTQFKWRVVAQFNNLLDFDAITLGNHEFDDNIAGVVPFLKNQSCPIVVSNLNTSLVPQMTNLTVSSVKFKVGEKTVGLVGYLTPDTMFIANTENLIILDEIESLKPEVARLHDEGVDIIVALGHSGYEKDKEIAASVPHLDVVIGGHTHSFLFSPTEENPNPSIDAIRGPYPTIVDNPAGHKTIVLQAFAYTKYLGSIDLKFSSSGDLESWSGSPVLLDNRFAPDPEIESQLAPYKKKLEEFSSQVLGRAAETLLIRREAESKLGNFVADAMVRSWQNKTMEDQSKIRLGITNAGGIRSSFDEGNITLADLMAAFPFQNTFDVIRIEGQFLREAFEHSVSLMTRYGQDGEGRFLQVSGFKVEYDVRNPVGNRVQSLKVVSEEEGEEYVDLEDEKPYYVVTSNYLVKGGDDYKMLHNNTFYVIGDLDMDVMRRAVEINSPIKVGLEDRIIIHADQTTTDQLNNSIDRIAGSILIVFISFLTTNII